MDGDHGNRGESPRGAGKAPEKLTREERLAAKLRENLHRRKAQARALAPAIGACASDEGGNAATNIESGRLSKSPPES